LYANLHGGYGGVDSSYVFVNLFAEPRGHAWSYPAVYDLVRKLRAGTGVDFDPYAFLEPARIAVIVQRGASRAPAVVIVNADDEQLRRSRCRLPNHSP
jgi:hypothetical protein